MRVTFKADGKIVEIIVSDDGRGFIPLTAKTTTKRNNVGNMRQRAATIGGKLEIQSSPGMGTNIRLKFNLVGGTTKQALSVTEGS